MAQDVEKKKYLMTVSQRPGFSHTFIGGKAYSAGSYPVELTEREYKSALRKPGVKLAPLADGSQPLHAGALVSLSAEEARLLSDYRATVAELRKGGAEVPDAATYGTFARLTLAKVPAGMSLAKALAHMAGDVAPATEEAPSPAPSASAPAEESRVPDATATPAEEADAATGRGKRGSAKKATE